jgi:hypothetical protein
MSAMAMVLRNRFAGERRAGGGPLTGVGRRPPESGSVTASDSGVYARR